MGKHREWLIETSRRTPTSSCRRTGATRCLAICPWATCASRGRPRASAGGSLCRSIPLRYVWFDAAELREPELLRSVMQGKHREWRDRAHVEDDAPRSLHPAGAASAPAGTRTSTRTGTGPSWPTTAMIGRYCGGRVPAPGDAAMRRTGRCCSTRSVLGYLRRPLGDRVHLAVRRGRPGDHRVRPRRRVGGEPGGAARRDRRRQPLRRARRALGGRERGTRR